MPCRFAAICLAAMLFLLAGISGSTNGVKGLFYCETVSAAGASVAGPPEDAAVIETFTAAAQKQWRLSMGANIKGKLQDGGSPAPSCSRRNPGSRSARPSPSSR